MKDYQVWVHMALIVVSALSVCCAMALLAQEIRTVFRSFFGIFYGPISQIRERVSRYIQRTRDWLLAQIADESDRAGDGPLYFIIGSVFYTLLTILFVLCDFGMTVLTLEAMGLDKVRVNIPVDTSTLTAGTLVSTALFWGAVLFDLLGITRLAPWRKSLSGFNRKLFTAIAVFFVSVTVFIGGTMAYWRVISIWGTPEAVAAPAFVAESPQAGLSLGNAGIGGEWHSNSASHDYDEMFPPETPTWVVLSTFVGIAGLSLASTAFSLPGAAIMLKFAILTVITLGAACLLPVSFFSWLSAYLIERISSCVETILDFFIGVGNRILGLFRIRTGENNSPPGPVPASPTQIEEAPPAFGPQPQRSAVDPGFNPFDERK